MAAKPDGVNEIPRVHRPNAATFFRDYVQRNRPAILTGIVTEWDAFRLWSREYLKAKAGSVEAAISVTRAKTFTFNFETKRYDHVKMTFGEYLDRIVDQKDDAPERLYLMAKPIALFPMLTQDAPVQQFLAEYVPSVKDVYPNLWFGPTGNISPLHYDLAHNFLSQITGRKKAVLYDARDFSNLYPNSCLSGASNLSRVDIEQPDLARFPRFPRARRMECELKAGEVLFIPVYWWHQVYTLETSASINVWWPAGLKANLTRQYLRRLPLDMLWRFRRAKRRWLKPKAMQPAGAAP